MAQYIRPYLIILSLSEIPKFTLQYHQTQIKRRNVITGRL